MMRTFHRLAPTAILAALLTTGCDLDVPDLNNPGISDLEDNPTRAAVSAASTGLLIGNRRNTAQANGLVSQLGILGRESYNFDQADPRYIGELLQGQLNQGSPFGGNFWTLPYANIRLANVIQGAIDRVPDFSDAERAALRGFTQTIEALDLLEIANTRDTNGGVIDTDRELGDELGEIVDKPALFAEIVRLLDDAATELAAGGDEFPFALSRGYAGFDTPMEFRTFNRAIRARVAAYLEDYAGVLTALDMSFINEMPTITIADLETGVYHAYSTGPGDQVNNLINPNIFAHPSLMTDAMSNGATIDARFTRKIEVLPVDEGGSAGGLASNLAFTIYGGPGAPVPIIRNEELILLQAEALFFTGNVMGAMTALNEVRTLSGGLTAIAGSPAEEAFVTALLYERRYSLMFEWGHRWIDARRFGRLEDLPLDMPEHVRNERYPLPLSECNARPGEPACMLGSL